MCILRVSIWQESHKVMDITTQKFHTSKDISFRKTIFPFSTTTQQYMFSIHIIGDQHDHVSLFPPPSPNQPQTSSQSQLVFHSTPTTQLVRRTTRLYKPPSYLHDYVCC